MKIKVKIENQTFDVNVGDLNTRPILATVDGQTFEVWPEEAPHSAVQPIVVSAPVAAAPAPAATPAAPAAGGAKASAIIAPIPGVIVTIGIKEGDTVKKGQELCVLEAMKMKNSIRASRDGVIGSIKVKVGDHVQHSQVLMEYKN